MGHLPTCTSRSWIRSWDAGVTSSVLTPAPHCTLPNPPWLPFRLLGSLEVCYFISKYFRISQRCFCYCFLFNSFVVREPFLYDLNLLRFPGVMSTRMRFIMINLHAHLGRVHPVVGWSAMLARSSWWRVLLKFSVSSLIFSASFTSCSDSHRCL